MAFFTAILSYAHFSGLLKSSYIFKNYSLLALRASHVYLFNFEVSLLSFYNWEVNIAYFSYVVKFFKVNAETTALHY
jgi:hypothetical protein